MGASVDGCSRCRGRVPAQTQRAKKLFLQEGLEASMTVVRMLLVRAGVAVAALSLGALGFTSSPNSTPASAPRPTDLNIRIVGTAAFQGRTTALIEDLNTHSDSFYKVGDPIYGYKVKEISAAGIYLEKEGRRAFVPLESTSIRARQTQDKDVVVANTYLPSSSDLRSSPNFYTDFGKSGTNWDLLGGKRSTASAKAPALAGDLVTAATATSRFAMPIASFKKLSSGFGYRKHPIGGGTKMHKGIDLAANRGTKIFAADAGKVKWSGWKGGYGYCVIIDHLNGYETLYGHCSKLIADVGDNVRKRDFIAEVGSTGASTGNHLHFEVHKNGTPVDPEPHVPGL